MNTSDNGRYESDESVEQTIRALAASNAGNVTGNNRLENPESREIAELGRALRASLEWEAERTSSPTRKAALRERLEAEMSALSGQAHFPSCGESKLIQPAGAFEKVKGIARSGAFPRWVAIAVVLVALASLSIAFYRTNGPFAVTARDSVGAKPEHDRGPMDHAYSKGESAKFENEKHDSPLANDSDLPELTAPPSEVAGEQMPAPTGMAKDAETASGLKSGINLLPKGNLDPVRKAGGGGGGFGGGDSDGPYGISDKGIADSSRALRRQDSASSNSPEMPAAPGGGGPPESQSALMNQPAPVAGNPPANYSFEAGGLAIPGQLSAGGIAGGRGSAAAGEKSGEVFRGGLGLSEELETGLEADAQSRQPDTDRDEQSAEQYEQTPENTFQTTYGLSAYSTFSIDVDTASMSNIRRFLSANQMPPRQAVRIEEMINSFTCEYSPPVDGQPFAVHLDIADSPWNEAHKLVRIGLKGREIARDSRPPSNLVFLIDVSGSMADDNKLPLLKQSLLMLVDNLTENDRIAIVTYANDSSVRLDGVSGDQKEKIRSAIESLGAGGSTNGSAGIQTAYDLATGAFIPGGTNRVILATDGDLNVGITDDNELVQLIKSRAESGVFLSVLGFGTGNLKDAKLEKLADNGNGHYHYIDDFREAQRVLVAGMCGTLVTIASDVKLQVEFNPAVVSAWRLIGYENRVLRKEDFDNDRVDAGDIGAGHTVTALYEIIPGGAERKQNAVPANMRYQKLSGDLQETVPTGAVPELTEAAHSGEMLAVFVRYKDPGDSESKLLTVPVKATSLAFENAPVDFRFVAAVAGFGMKLRQSAYAGNWTWADVENTAVGALGEDSNGQRAELIKLIRQARQLLGK